jgi:hypothetical protein
MRPARRDASTASRLRLVRDPLDGRPRLRPVPYDKTPRPNSDSREPGSRRSIPSFSTYLGTKVIAFNAITYYHLPAWPQSGSTWEQYQCQSSLFYPHPVMGGEKRHYTHLTAHCTSPVTLEGGYDKVRTPRFQGFGLIRSASTRPRPGLDPASTPKHSTTGKEGRYGAALRVISASRPL